MENWKIVRNYEQFTDYIVRNYKKGYFPKLIAFDHDLSDIHYEIDNDYWKNFSSEELGIEKTGMDCATWLVNFCIDNKLKLPEYVVHSMNPSGKENIESLLDNYRKHEALFDDKIDFMA